ncbi:hypothetical protein [Bacillus sp. FJAT-47783]|uniref:hypothetical protein n=1 Tax=Bacillus sp. FJAT-47783 TaxID=2922712 RepID=UPI001FABA27D|nr:hypothetical protein [Bacillus sp. FJAT-47783]
MVGYWLTTIFFTFMFILMIISYLYTIKTSVNSEDAYKIDPLPNARDDDKPNT